mmetsp:Transcript_21658/g.53069  ORF Transcript_21658/g.53069 Transcript_21658/m.53069 type:complete len:235 (+) Transcript_21658:465-1169(+)
MGFLPSCSVAARFNTPSFAAATPSATPPRGTCLGMGVSTVEARALGAGGEGILGRAGEVFAVAGVSLATRRAAPGVLGMDASASGSRAFLPPAVVLTVVGGVRGTTVTAFPCTSCCCCTCWTCWTCWTCTCCCCSTTTGVSVSVSVFFGASSFCCVSSSFLTGGSAFCSSCSSFSSLALPTTTTSRSCTASLTNTGAAFSDFSTLTSLVGPICPTAFPELSATPATGGGVPMGV